jgi:hypothetical protein
MLIIEGSLGSIEGGMVTFVVGVVGKGGISVITGLALTELPEVVTDGVSVTRMLEIIAELLKPMSVKKQAS